MSGGHLAASRSESDVRKLQGKRLRCGEDTRRRFAQLLGLDSAATYEVTAVLWLEDHVELSISGDGVDGGLTIVLDATREEQSAFLRGAEVSLWFRQAEIPPRLASILRQRAARNLKGLRLRDLARAVVLDPDNEATGGGDGEPSPDGVSLPTAIQHAWTHAAFYADFFAASELRRAGGDIVDIHSAHTQVCHGDVECSYCAVWVPRPRTSLLRLPVYETVRNIGRLPRGQGRFDESEDLSDLISSDLTEQDVILGAPGRIEQALRHADRSRKKDRLMVIGVCLPDVLGEDQDAAVVGYAAKTKTPVFMVPAAPRSWAWFARDMLETRRAATVGDADVDRRAVNLIGFADNAGTRDLDDKLRALGVRVNTLVLPEMNMAAVELISRAALNVYLPNTYWEKAYGYLQSDAGREHLSVQGPYGMDGTSAWIQRVCGALGEVDSGPESIAAHCEAWMAPLAQRWNELQAEARTHRVGLVVSDEEIANLLEPRFSWGIALLPVLHEMGFGLDLFVGGARAEAAIRRFRTDTSLPPEAYSIERVDSLPCLLDALSKSRCRAVFSNYVFDWRLVRTGKTPFSTLEFEMGFAGAVSTLERLLAICRLPLFQAGRRFLQGAAPAGYDDA